MQKFTVHKVPTIDEINELVGLNILLANYQKDVKAAILQQCYLKVLFFSLRLLLANCIENLLSPQDKQQHENSDE